MRKMKKFAEGGRAARGQARYDRMMKDIESDYAKKKDKPGRAGEIAKAKYEQRKADAKDDLAKARGEDRSQTRAAEKAAEFDLSRTRKTGSFRQVTPAVKADTVAKVSSTDDVLKSAPKPQAVSEKSSAPQKFADAFRAARSAGDKTFTWRGKSYTTKMAGEGSAKPTPRAGAGKPTPRAGAGKPTGQGTKAGTGAGKVADAGKPPAVTLPASKSNITFGRQDVPKPATAAQRFAEAQGRKYGRQTGGDAQQRARWSAVEAQSAKDAKLYQLKAAAEAPGASQFAKDRYRMAKETGMYASGGTVKKKSTPPRKPLPPTAQELRNRDKENKSIEKAKPSAADAAAIGRGNRSSGMKKGGTVMKKANKFGNALVKKSADTKGRAMMKKAGGGKCYAKGGSVSARADGCATKGKTKGKMV